MNLTSRQPGRRPGLGSTARTQCKLCDLVILVSQPTVWLNRPMGLSHTDCATSATQEGDTPR